jgi:AcrR family transcriptional regulator
VVDTISTSAGTLSHNLLGQRLGKKGRDSRVRIIAATEKLLAGPIETPISLSAVAREASLGMSTLYLYFSDLTELLLAVLEPIMASAEQTYMGQLRARWPGDTLDQHCIQFVEAYYAFWVRHSRILHLRNSFADGGDERMRRHRIAVSQPVLSGLVRQMASDPDADLTPAYGMGTVMMTGIERLVTVTTDASFPTLMGGEDPRPHVSTLLRAEARLLELAIRDVRQEAKPG